MNQKMCLTTILYVNNIPEITLRSMRQMPNEVADCVHYLKVDENSLVDATFYMMNDLDLLIQCSMTMV